jgi:hypothetical protein
LIQKETLKENGYERETKSYTYSNDGLNLLLTEKDSTGKTIEYKYKRKSDRLKAKYLSYNEKIRLREFYFYDSNHALEKKTLDDGSLESYTDFTDVTERHYTLIVLRKEAPIGLPESTEEITDKQYKSYINEFQSVFSKQMERKFNLTWIEGGFLGNFSIDTIEFYAYRRATLDEARALMLTIMNELAEAIHANPKILSYLNMLSLTPESIRIYIKFANSNDWSYNDGSIDDVYSTYSKEGTNDFQERYLQYSTTDPFNDHNETLVLVLKNPLKTLSNLMLQYPS